MPDVDLPTLIVLMALIVVEITLFARINSFFEVEISKNFRALTIKIKMSMKDLVGGVADCDDGNALRQFAGHMQRERPIQRVFSHFLN